MSGMDRTDGTNRMKGINEINRVNLCIIYPTLLADISYGTIYKYAL